MTPQRLPIDTVLPRIKTALSEKNCVVLEAPPGAGKTTRVPPSLLDEPWLGGRSIVVLEPRRLAARAAASRMADERGETPGGVIGYRIRLDAKVSARTRIEVVTEGILTRRLQSDPELTGVGLLVFDEFHERSIHADLALALALDIQESLRPELRILIMSATLDGGRIAEFLGGAAVVRAEGRSFPVEVRYAERRGLPPADAAARIASRALSGGTGDILVFLPGAREINRAKTILEDDRETSEALICPLHGELSQADQDRAINRDPQGRRRVILSTNIAETSLTIEGVSIVIDSGLARFLRFDPRTGMGRLETARITKDSAAQRAGRAGRTGPGVCVRLYEEQEFARLGEHIVPEILETDLASFLLELAAWGTAPEKMRFLDPPPATRLAAARALLSGLDGLDADGRITSFGKVMAMIPVHPRLAKMLASAPPALRGMAAQAAAVISERDIMRPIGRDRLPCDLRLRLDILSEYQETRHITEKQADRAGVKRCARLALDMQRVLKTALDRVDSHTAVDSIATLPGCEQAGALLSLAYPDRIAAGKAGPGRYLLSGGRGAALPEGDALAADQTLAVAEIDGGSADARVRLAAPVPIEWLRTHFRKEIQIKAQCRFDSTEQRVICQKVELLGAAPISTANSEATDAQAAALLGDVILQRGLESLPWTDEAKSFVLRIEFLRKQGFDLPDSSAQALTNSLHDWLMPFLTGIKRWPGIQKLDLLEILQTRLTHAQRRLVDLEAPLTVQVPSGSQIKLEYTETDVILSVKLQELFGQRETPRIAGGRFSVLVHLLSPARRPVQVTRDLAGFWDKTYQEVRKELRGRYPKHPWPEDPRTAQATKYTKKRSG